MKELPDHYASQGNRRVRETTVKEPEHLETPGLNPKTLSDLAAQVLDSEVVMKIEGDANEFTKTYPRGPQVAETLSTCSRDCRRGSLDYTVGFSETPGDYPTGFDLRGEQRMTPKSQVSLPEWMDYSLDPGETVKLGFRAQNVPYDNILRVSGDLPRIGQVKYFEAPADFVYMLRQTRGAGRHGSQRKTAFSSVE